MQLKHKMLNQIIAITDIPKWIAMILAFSVSLLTLYNAFKLRSGVLAVSTYAFGAGMVAVTLGLFIMVVSPFTDVVVQQIIYYLLFVVGFALLGAGSLKIYQMSRIK